MGQTAQLDSLRGRRKTKAVGDDAIKMSELLRRVAAKSVSTLLFVPDKQGHSILPWRFPFNAFDCAMVKCMKTEVKSRLCGLVQTTNLSAGFVTKTEAYKDAPVRLD